MSVVTVVSHEHEEHVERELAKTWSEHFGWVRWFTAVDHKTIGLRFVVTAMVFFSLAGIAALLMRFQLAFPENTLVDADLYNQLFTMHGTTMMFLFAVPVMQGMAIYLIPLMVGARALAFPRLNAFAYWMYLGGGLLLWISFFLNTGPDIGWFSYVPLAGPEYGIGKRPDVWVQLVNFTELSGVLVATQLIVTILKLRTPGMTLARMPLYAWTILVMSFMVLFAMPSVMTSSLYLGLDRLVGTHFYNPAEGGDAVLWQHLFWFFAHPEVYIIFLPATGFISSILVPFTRRTIFGYTAIVLSIVATGFIGFGVWVHHMFALGFPQLGQSFFTAASLLITIPTGIQIFCWIATIWLGTPRFTTAFLFALGFVINFVMGGLTGVILASVPLDIQVHDTFFVVAHLHYVLIGGAVFPLLGAFYYWFPKATGRLMSERLGRWNFALVFIGFNLTFFPMHQLGLAGMPRRVQTYLAETGWGDLNLLATIGAGILGVGVLTLVANAVTSLRRGAVAGHDPWGSDTLEWATSSPPPRYNFAFAPIVEDRSGLWGRTPETPFVSGLRSDSREVLVTRVLDADPDHRTDFPEPTPWPFFTALAVGGMFVGLIFTPWALVAGTALASVGAIFWFWPSREEREKKVASEKEPETVAEVRA